MTPVLAALGIAAWVTARRPGPTVAAAAISFPLLLGTVLTWPHLVPGWLWPPLIIVEGAGLAAAYLAVGSADER